MSKKGFCRYSGDVVVNLGELRTKVEVVAAKTKTSYSKLFESNDISSAFFKNSEFAYTSYCKQIERDMKGAERYGITSIPRLKRICELCNLGDYRSFVVEEIPFSRDEVGVEETKSDNLPEGSLDTLVKLLTETNKLLENQNKLLGAIKQQQSTESVKVDHITEHLVNLGKVSVEIMKILK